MRQSLCSGVLNPATSDAATLVQTTGFLSPLVASSGNHSPVVVSQFCHGPPPLTHVSDDSLATISRGEGHHALPFLVFILQIFFCHSVISFW